MIDQIDKDGNGEIDFAEFVALMAQEMDESHVKDEILAVFRMFDKAGNGSMSREDFTRILSRLEERLTEREILEIISDVDKDGKGEIAFEEFFRVMLPEA
jgi:calmodulin